MLCFYKEKIIKRKDTLFRILDGLQLEKNRLLLEKWSSAFDIRDITNKQRGDLIVKGKQSNQFSRRKTKLESLFSDRSSPNR